MNKLISMNYLEGFHRFHCFSNGFHPTFLNVLSKSCGHIKNKCRTEVFAHEKICPNDFPTESNSQQIHALPFI